MSLPISGGPPPPSHTPLPPDQVVPLARALMKTGRGAFAANHLSELADSAGVPVSHAYVAAGMLPMVRFEREHEVVFVVCSGGCQSQGSLGILEKLLETRDHRIEAGEPAFDVQTRGCLNGCSYAPLVEVQTKEGVGHIPKATFESVDEVLETLAEER